MHKVWSYAKQTEKRVEDIYSDVKKVSLCGLCSSTLLFLNIYAGDIIFFSIDFFAHVLFRFSTDCNKKLERINKFSYLSR